MYLTWFIYYMSQCSLKPFTHNKTVLAPSANNDHRSSRLLMTKLMMMPNTKNRFYAMRIVLIASSTAPQTQQPSTILYWMLACRFAKLWHTNCKMRASTSVLILKSLASAPSSLVLYSHLMKHTCFIIMEVHISNTINHKDAFAKTSSEKTSTNLIHMSGCIHVFA